MASRLAEICEVFANVVVSFDAAGTPTNIMGKTLADIPPFIEVLPVRLVLPPGVYSSAGGGASGLRYFGFGDGRQVTWNLVDLALFEYVAVGQSIGIKYEVMTGYLQALIPAITANKRPTSNSFILDVRPSMGVIEYPRGSKRFYNGVQTVVSVQETIC